MPLWTPRPDAAVPLSNQDWRQALVGTWRTEFNVDSMVRLHGGEDGQWSWRAPLDTATVKGTLVLGDTLVGTGNGRGLRAHLAVDFRPALGRQMSCLGVTKGLAASRTGARSVRLWFTPGAHDCGFGGLGEQRGDTIAGTWSEGSIAGIISTGRFRLVRSRSTP
jgi:hypothetical protein